MRVRRLLGRTLLALAVLLVLVVGALWLALHTETVQRAVLESASETLERRFGLRLEAESIDFSPSSGALELGGLTVSDSQRGSLATIESVRGRVRLLPLLGNRLVVPELALDRPTIDLGRLPDPLDKEADATAEDGAPVVPPVEIASLRILGGALTGLPTPELGDHWQWHGGLDEIEIEAQLVEGRLAAGLTRATTVLRRGELDSLSLELGAVLAGPLSGPFELTEARVRSDDLTLSLSGILGVADEQPFELEFDGRFDAGRLLGADLAAPVSASGELDLRAGGGRATIEVSRAPAELAARWLGPSLGAELSVAGTAVDLNGDLELGPGALDQVRGSLTGSWRRGESELLTLEASPEIVGSERSARVPFILELTPDLPGGRRLDGRLAIADWDELADATIEDGRLELELPEVRETLASVAEIWPSAPRAGRFDGSLELGGSLSGPLLEPEVDLDGVLRAGDLSSLQVSIAGAPTVLRGRVAARAESVSLAELGGAASGVVDGRVEVVVGPSGLTGSFDLAAREVAAGDGNDLDLIAVGELAGGGVAVTRLELASESHRLTTAATVEPTPDGLRIVTEGLRVDGVAAELEADLHAALLPRADLLPRLFGAPAWSTPASRERRLRLAWDLLRSDLGPLLGAEDAELDLATSGDVSIDLGVPSASTGEILLSVFEWTAGDRRVALADGLELRWADGVLVAPGTRFTAGGSSFTGDLSVGLSDRWRPGDPWDSLIADARIVGHGVVGAGWPGELVRPAPLSEAPLDFDLELRADRSVLGGDLRVDGGGSFLEARGAADLAADWRPGDPWASSIAAVDLTANGHLAASWVGALLGAVEPADGALTIDLDLAGRPEALSGALTVGGPELVLGLLERGRVRLESPRIDLRVADRSLTLERLDASVNGRPLTGRGSARIAGGRLELERLELVFDGVEGVWSGGLPLDETTDEVRLEWRVAETELGPALALFELIGDEDTLRLGSTGSFRLPLSDPARLEGSMEVTGFEWTSRGRRTHTQDPIRASAGEGRLRLEPLRLLSEDQAFDLVGTVDLVAGWSSEAELLDLFGELEVRGSGTLLTSVLNPFLSGAVADGHLEVELEAVGPPCELRGRLTARGSDARLTYVRPYATRLSDPDLQLLLEPGGIARLDGSLALNEGRIELSGAATDGVLNLDATIEGARFRLDHGLLALLNGDLILARSSTGAWALGGTVEVENGVLTRDVDLDLDLVAGLLSPVDLTSTEASPLEAFALDLDLTTVEGIRVKNNIADLLVRWDPIRIRGSLASPVLAGRFDVEPGGRVRAFGQTVRIDGGSIDFPGVADLPATVDLDMTSSLEDPSIGSLARDDPFAGHSDLDQDEDESARLEAAASGLGMFYGERLASRLSSGVTGARVSLQPLLIFGEADPGARLTVSQDFSPQVTLAASIDLRNAERRTYLLDIHRLDAAPGLNAQVITTDEASQGASLGQRLLLGPGGAPRVEGPKIRRIRWELPDRVSKRRVKRAAALRKGDRLAPGGRFAAEVDVVEALRRRGYTDARASIEEIEVDGGVELVVAVQSGPRSRFEFVGTELPKPLRRPVVDLYRADYYETAALEEMAAEARRALRSVGYLEPVVEVRVDLDDPARPEGDRTVVVSMAGGERVELERIRFVPLPPDETELLAARFSRPVGRVELAAGLADADRRVEQSLRFLGYGDPRVVDRRILDRGRELEVVLELGERPRIGSIEITGVESGEAARLERLIELQPGDPVRSDRIAGAALALREDLRSRGFSDAVVEPRVTLAERDSDAELSFAVEPGTSYFLSEVGFTGLRSTRSRFVKTVADLELEGDFSQVGLMEARRRLWSTQLFEIVTPEVARAPGGAVRVDFGVREKRRFEFAYGLRWDSEEEASALLEVIDRNALGRGWTAGLRTRWSEDLQSVRTFAGLPRLFNARSSLGLFAAFEEETKAGLITETIEGTVQLGYELTGRLTLRLYGRLTDTHVREEIPDPRFPFDVRLTRPVLGTQLLYDRRSGHLLSQRGLLTTADLTYSDSAFGSDFDYARFFGQVSYFKRLFGPATRPWIWAQSARVGIAEAFDQELIRPERFFAGGEFSVRGYLTESLGPQERLGPITRAVGGESLLVINQELRWRFAESFTATLFVDAGNVWVRASDLGSELVYSTGIGLRALTPVGILRLDLAHALDRRPIDPEYKLYVGFGNTF